MSIFSGGPEPVVDLTNLRDILGDDPSSIREILRLFIDMRGEIEEAFREAFAERDRTRLFRAAHQLKGTARNLGAHRLADLATELERSAPEGKWRTLYDLHSRVAAEAQEVVRFAEEY